MLLCYIEYMSENAICLDFGEKNIRIVDANLKGNLINVVSFGQAQATPFFFNNDAEKTIENQAQIINSLYTSLKIKKRDVHVVIPDALSYSHIIEVPKLNEKELQSAIRYQADQFIPMPLEEISLDIEVLRDDPKAKKSTILLVASPKKIVNQIEKTVNYAGLNPESLENEFSVMRRLFLEILKFPPSASFLLVNIGYTTTSIYLINPATFTLIPRTIKIGLELFIKDIKLNLNIDERKTIEILQTIGFENNASINLRAYTDSILKELVAQINKFIILAKDNYNLAINQIYFFNLNTYIKSLEKEIQGLVSIPAQSLSLASYLVPGAVSNSFAPYSSSFACAVAGNIR